MGSNETATATTGAPQVIDVFYGNGAPSGPNNLLFSDADQLLEASRGGSGCRWSPVPHTPSMRRPSALGEPWKQTWPKYGSTEWSAERNRLKMIEAAAYAA